MKYFNTLKYFKNAQITEQAVTKTSAVTLFVWLFGTVQRQDGDKAVESSELAVKLTQKIAAS